MKNDMPTQAGIGLTLILAATTFAIAVVAGIFLLYQPDAVLPNGESSIAPQAQISMAPTPDAERLSQSHAGEGR